MTTVHTREQLFSNKAWKTVRRPGLAVDWTAGVDFDIFTVTGVVIVSHMYGVVTTVIGAGAPVAFVEITTVVPAATVPLCAVTAASITTDAVGTFYTWNGLIAGVLTPGAVLGAQDMAAANTWGGALLVLTDGVINIDNAGGASTGIIDWYIRYMPMTPNAVVTIL